MKKVLTFVLAVLFAFSLAGVALAQDAGTSAAAPAKKVTKKKAAKKKAARYSVVIGTVSSVDTTANTVTVKGRKGEVTLNATDKTIVKKGRKKITLADVKAGDKVYARYSKENGKDVAKLISVHTVVKKAKKAKKAKKKAAAPAAK